MRAETLGAIFEGAKNPDNGVLPSSMCLVAAPGIAAPGCVHAARAAASASVPATSALVMQGLATCTDAPSTPLCAILGSSWPPWKAWRPATPAALVRSALHHRPGQSCERQLCATIGLALSCAAHTSLTVPGCRHGGNQLRAAAAVQHRRPHCVLKHRLWCASFSAARD